MDITQADLDRAALVLLVDEDGSYRWSATADHPAPAVGEQLRKIGADIIAAATPDETPDADDRLRDGIVGRIVRRVDDDRVVPTWGLVLTREDEDRVGVLWGDARHRPEVHAAEADVEFVDDLVPASTVATSRLAPRR